MEYRLAPRWGGAVRLAEFCKNRVKHPPLHAPIFARRLGGRCLVSRYYARASADHDCTLLRNFHLVSLHRYEVRRHTNDTKQPLNPKYLIVDGYNQVESSAYLAIYFCERKPGSRLAHSHSYRTKPKLKKNNTPALT